MFHIGVAYYFTTSGDFLTWNACKCVGGWGYAQTLLGELTALPQTPGLSWIWEEGGEEREGKGKWSGPDQVLEEIDAPGFKTSKKQKSVTARVFHQHIDFWPQCLPISAVLPSDVAVLTLCNKYSHYTWKQKKNRCNANKNHFIRYEM